MNRKTMIRYPDGIREYDEKIEAEIADEIYEAMQAIGGENRDMADELAQVVTTCLQEGKFGVEIRAEMPIGDVRDVVEKVLIETGHAKTAKHYILNRVRKSKEERKWVRILLQIV